MGDHFMADHIEHDEDFIWNEDVKPLWKPQEISEGEYIVNDIHILDCAVKKRSVDKQSVNYTPCK
jgi:hypothetical protein